MVGALTGLVGAMAALEAIKLIARAGTPLVGRIWIVDALNAESRTVKLARDPACRTCGAP